MASKNYEHRVCFGVTHILRGNMPECMICIFFKTSFPATAILFCIQIISYVRPADANYIHFAISGTDPDHLGSIVVSIDFRFIIYILAY